MGKNDELLMVALGVIMYQTCKVAEKKQVDILTNKVNVLVKAENERTYVSPDLQVRNVIGGMQNETFYEINGQRFYLKIDEQPVVANYVPK